MSKPREFYIRAVSDAVLFDMDHISTAPFPGSIHVIETSALDDLKAENRKLDTVCRGYASDIGRFHEENKKLKTENERLDVDLHLMTKGRDDNIRTREQREVAFKTAYDELKRRLEVAKVALDFYTKHPIHWAKDENHNLIPEGPSRVAIAALDEINADYSEGGAG